MSSCSFISNIIFFFSYNKVGLEEFVHEAPSVAEIDNNIELQDSRPLTCIGT